MSFIYKEMSNKDKKKIRWKFVVSWGRLQTIKEEKLYFAIDSEQKFFIILCVDGDWTGEYLLRYGMYSYKGQQVKFAYRDDFRGGITIERLIIPRKIANNLKLILNLFKEGVSAYEIGSSKKYALTITTNVIIKEVFIPPKRTFSSYYYEFKNALVQNSIHKKLVRLFWLFFYSLSMFVAVFVWGLITE